MPSHERRLTSTLGTKSVNKWSIAKNLNKDLQDVWKETNVFKSNIEQKPAKIIKIIDNSSKIGDLKG